LAAGQVPSLPAVPLTEAKAPSGPPKKAEAPNPAAAAAPSAAPAAPQENPRLQKLRQQQFDRRPSAILKAWAPPPPDEPRTPAASKTPPPKPDPIDAELAYFRRLVTLGHWPAVRAYLASLPEDEARAGYQQLLTSLQGGPQGGPGMQRGMMMMP